MSSVSTANSSLRCRMIRTAVWHVLFARFKKNKKLLMTKRRRTETATEVTFRSRTLFEILNFLVCFKYWFHSKFQRLSWKEKLKEGGSQTAIKCRVSRVTVWRLVSSCFGHDLTRICFVPFFPFVMMYTLNIVVPTSELRHETTKSLSSKSH